MQFLVEITVDFPADLHDPDSPRRKELVAAERERGRELRRAGTIQEIWRRPGAPPGGLRNVGVWSADDEGTLRELIRSLPLGNWIAAEVTPLSEHPIERALRDADRGQAEP